jgi:hypothetical protein
LTDVRLPRLVLLLGALCAAVPTRAAEPPVIGWEQAAQHIGKEVIVEGRVMGVHCSPLSCLLAFEPTFNGFTAVIQARSFDTFPPAELDQRFTGRRVRVRGTVVDRDKKPEIEVSSKDALELADKPTPADRAAALAERSAQAQVEVLERIADVLERLEDLTERLAAVQERMDVVLANMEQREAALAAAQAQAAAAAAPPPGEPAPRPGFESLRTLKRGMTTDEVERLVGQPQYVETGGNGWTTWYYGPGRSISFDGRGRARSLTGFAQP